MGAYGSERTKQSLKDFPVVDSEDEEEQVSLLLFLLFFLRMQHFPCLLKHDAMDINHLPTTIHI